MDQNGSYKKNYAKSHIDFVASSQKYLIHGIFFKEGEYQGKSKAQSLGDRRTFGCKLEYIAVGDQEEFNFKVISQSKLHGHRPDRTS